MNHYLAILTFYTHYSEIRGYENITRIELRQDAKNETEALEKIIKRAEKLASHKSIAKEKYFVESFIEKVDREN